MSHLDVIQLEDQSAVPPVSVKDFHGACIAIHFEHHEDENDRHLVIISDGEVFPVSFSLSLRLRAFAERMKKNGKGE
jgi:hypothetical protein